MHAVRVLVDPGQVDVIHGPDVHGLDLLAQLLADFAENFLFPLLGFAAQVEIPDLEGRRVLQNHLLAGLEDDAAHHVVAFDELAPCVLVALKVEIHRVHLKIDVARYVARPQRGVVAADHVGELDVRQWKRFVSILWPQRDDRLFLHVPVDGEIILLQKQCQKGFLLFGEAAASGEQ